MKIWIERRKDGVGKNEMKFPARPAWGRYIESEYRYVKPVLEERPQTTSDTSALVVVAPGSEDVDLSKRTLADDILDSVFKVKLEELLA